MRLISCYIENYGSISRKEFNFDGDMTCICEDNGYGKSTLASFIKAMFYGLEPYKKNTREFTERQHYCPFGGGKFGGNVTFTADGKTYKIERFFGEKSDLTDEYNLYCGGVLLEEIDAGQYFFGLDRQSFGRTVFIDGGDVEISSTAGINSKLNCFLEGGESFDLTAALAGLEKTAKKYKKSRTENDLISQEKKKIQGLNLEITNAENIKLALDGKYGRYGQLKKQIAASEASLERAQTLNIELNDWEHYDSLIKEAQSDLAAVKAIEDGYAFGMPSAAETEDAAERLLKDGELKARLAQSTFDESDAAKLAALSAAFADGLPTGEQLAQAESKISDLTQLQVKIKAAEQRQPSERDKKLKLVFGSYLPSDAEVEGVRQKVEKIKNAQSEDLPAAHKKTNLKIYLAAAVILAVLAVAGIAVVFVQMIAGIILLALGVLGLAADGFMYLNNKGGRTAENAEMLRRAQVQAELSDGVKAFLMPFGYSSDNGIVYDFATFCDDLKYYKNIAAAERAAQNSLDEMRKNAAQAEEFLNGFFNTYGVRGESHMAGLSKLRVNAEEYARLKELKQRSERNLLELKDQISKNYAAVTQLCEKYHIDVQTVRGKLKQIESDRRGIEEYKRRAESAQNKARELKESKGLEKRPEGESIDIQALSAQLNKMRGEESLLYREIESDEGEAEKLVYLKANLEAAEHRLKEYAKKHEILTTTADLLRAADQSLKDRYVKPIKDKFVYYSELLERTLGEKVTMNKEFEITFERNGKERSDKHLSAGQRSLAALCFRLALVYNMYSKEKPFIIMDDPFINLDKTHMARVKEVLGELSHGMQIIYFCCHESRII